jgi:glucose/arabinose dehydrogenase
VSGAEHIAWDQVGSYEQAQKFSFVAYVDGVRQSLPDAICRPSSTGTAVQCMASLPKMKAGSHRLELAAVASADGSEVESVRSAPLLLVVATSSAMRSSPAITGSPQPRARKAADGTRFTVRLMAAPLKLPSALAVLPDDRMLIAEHAGIIRAYRKGQLLDVPALDLKSIDGSVEVGPAGIAVDPRFSENGRLFVVYTSHEGNGRFVHRVLRVRELDSTLVDPVVILQEPTDRLPDRAPRARFGPEGKLYVGFPASTEDRASDAASYDGKILRLNEDGSTPADNPGYSPIISSPHRAPVAFDWPPGGSVPWLAERDWRDRDVLFLGAAASSPVYVFDPVLGAADAAFYTSTSIAEFTGNLFIAGFEGMHIRRVRFDTSGRVAGTERLFDNEYGRIGDVVIAPDGALYFCTANSSPDDPTSNDAIFRIVGE